MEIAGHQVEAEIGRGGSGIVYRARARDGRKVAIKVLRQRRTEEPALRLEREARLLAELGEGFVPLLETGELPGGAPYLVMPFLEGGTLRDKLRRGPLPVAEAIELGRKLARALARAHAQGIVHRDLKPDNIIYDDGGAPLIADLGLGKHLENAESIGITKSRDVRGTAGYAAPEQMESTRDVDATADVFSLGAILYECLAGHGPFEEPTAIAAIVRAANEAYAPLATERPEAPPWLVRAIERTLARDPEGRFPDAGALLAVLEKGEIPRSRSRAILALAALVLAGALASLLLRGREAPAAHGPRLELAQVLGSYAFTHAQEVRALAFSPDGRFAISGGEDRAARIFEVPGGREVRSLAHRSANVVSVALSADAETALVAEEGERTVTVWSRSGAESHNTSSPAGAVAISTDGARALVGLEDGTVEVRSVPDWDLVSIATHHEGPVKAVLFSPDGKRTLSIAKGRVRLTSPDEEAPLPPGNEGCAAFAPDGRSAAIGMGGKVTLVPERRTLGAGGIVAGVGFLAAETPCAVTWPGRFRSWSPEADRSLDASPVKAASVSPDGKWLLAAAGSGARLWDLASWKEVGPAGHRGAVSALAPVASTTRVLSGGLDGSVRLWDLATGAGELLGRHASRVYAVAVSEDGRQGVSSSWDGAVKVWDLDARRFVRAYEGHEHGKTNERSVDAVAISRTGLVASAGRAGEIRLWSLATGKEERVLSGHTARVHFLGFASGDRLVSCAEDGLVLAWDGETKRKLWESSRPITAMAVSGPRVLAGTDGRLVLRRVDDGSVRELDNGHEGTIFSAAFSPDGAMAVSGGGRDGRICLWDLATGKLVERVDLASSQDFVHSVAFTPDGRSVLVGTFRGVILRYALGTGNINREQETGNRK